MDWDLWGPPDFQVSPERDCQLQPGGQFDNYFGHGTDVLEETALNEKCCAQVLRILIKNADNEIDELEETLVVLQSQLAWAEYEEWSEICGTALQEKIKYLSISISNLRNEKDHDSNVQLQLHRGPAEKIHEIFKALLKNFSQERDPQHFVKESSSHTLGCATDCSDESKKLSGSDTNIIVKEEMELASSSAGKCTAGNSSLTPETERKKIDSPKKTPDVIIRSSNNASKHVTGCTDGKERAYDSNFISTRDEVNEHHCTPTTKNIGLAPSLEHGEEKRDLEGKIKPFIKESSSHTVGCATECLDEREKLSESESNIFVEEEMQELATTLAGKCTAPNSSLRSQGKKTNSPKKIPDVIIRSSNNASKYVTGCTDGKKKAYDSNFRNTRDEVNEHRSTPTTKNTILAPFLDPGEEKTDLEVKVKPYHVEGSSLDDSKQVNCCYNENKSLCKPNLEVLEKEEVKNPKSTSTERCIKRESFSKSAGHRTNLSKINKPVNATLRDPSSDAMRHATGLNSEKSLTGVDGKKNLSNSVPRLNAMGKAQSGNSTVEPKRSHSTSEATSTERIKESKDLLDRKNGSSNSSAKKEGNRMNPPQKVKVQDAEINDPENITVASRLDMQTQIGNDTIRPRLKDEGKAQVCEVQKIEIVYDDKSSFDQPLKLQRWKNEKMKTLPNLPSIQEGSFSVKIDSGKSSISKAKRKQESGSDDNVTLLQFMNGKIGKKSVEVDQCRPNHCFLNPNVPKKIIQQSQKKRKNSSDLPVLVEIKDFSFQDGRLKLHGDTTDIGSKEESSTTKSCFVGNSDERTVPLLPTSRLVNLNALTLVDLRAIAKQKKLTGYSKLRKTDLVQKLASRLP